MATHQPTTVQGPPTARARWAPIAVLALGAFSTGTDAFVIAGLLPEVAAALEVSPAAVGLTVTLFALAYALGSPLLTAATATVPRRRVLITSMALFALANLVAAAATHIAVLGLARVGAALTAAVFMPGAIAAASGLAGPRQRGRALAVVLGGSSTALILGVPLGTLVAEYATWRGSFGAVAGLAVVATLGMATLLRGGENPPRLGLRERLAVLRRVDVALVLLVTLLANTAAFSVYTYLSPLFSALPGGDRAVSLLVLGFGVGAVVGTWVGGHATDRYGATRVALLAVLLFAVNHYLLLAVTGSLPLALAYTVIWGVSGWGVIPAQQSRLVDLAGDKAPLALSLNSSATHLGTGLGALAGAAIISWSGPHWIWLFAGTTALVALCLVPLSTVAERRRQPAAHRTDQPR